MEHGVTEALEIIERASKPGDLYFDKSTWSWRVKPNERSDQRETTD